eukprot:3168294-Pyramimonas_sp.AAC.1
MRRVLQKFIDKIRPHSEVRAIAEKGKPIESYACNDVYITYLQAWFRQKAEQNEDDPPSHPTTTGTQ